MAENKPVPARLRDYRTVADRIDAFTQDYQGEGCIVSELLADVPMPGFITFRALVSRRCEDGQEWVLGNGHATAKFTGAEDQLEKLETAARGRALVAAGYTSSLEKAAELEAATEKVTRQEQAETVKFSDDHGPARGKVSAAPGHANADLLEAQFRPAFRQVIERMRFLAKTGAAFDSIKAYAAEHKPGMTEPEYDFARKELGRLRQECEANQPAVAAAPEAAPATPQEPTAAEAMADLDEDYY